ncbi:MAG: hypothetical protein KDK06_00930, partial [Gammaproteobacteria bacterium]|nr:hypothetical protein [Gammaproteobacteria bacterium]
GGTRPAFARDALNATIVSSMATISTTALGISRAGGARNPHVFAHTLRLLRAGGTRPAFARDALNATIVSSMATISTTALGISRAGGARNPHVFAHTLRLLRAGGTRPS